MTHAELVDITAISVAFLAPPLMIWRWRWRGAILGSLIFWLTIGAAGPLIAQLDPRRGPATLDTIWWLFGWIGGAAYSLMWLALRAGLTRLFRQHPRPTTVPGVTP